MTQLLTFDFAIVAAYLLVTLIVGLQAGRGITTVRQYVLGNRQGHTTFVLVATLFVTIIGGASTLGTSEKVFSVGLIWIIVEMGEAVGLTLSAFYAAPRMDRFRQKLTIGEMMGGFYGKSGRVVTGIAAAVQCTGWVGAQVSAIGWLFHYFVDLPHIWGIGIACGIVILYSAHGGIRSVAATDVIQFAILVVAVPVITLAIGRYAGGWQALCSRVPKTHLQFFSHADFWHYLFLFFLLSVPELNAAYMQRLLMGRDGRQVFKALATSALLVAILILLVASIGLSAAAVNPELDPRVAFPYAMDKALSVGFRGIGIAGLCAVIMSTADSFLHTAAVSLTHDAIQPLRQQKLSDTDELKLTRLVTVLLGISATVAAASFTSIFDLVLALWNAWAPVVIIPLWAGIVGYCSSVRSFIIAGCAGMGTVAAWQLGLDHIMPVGATIPAMAMNLLAFVIARQFDKPQDIYYDPDDGLARIAKQKAFKRAEEAQQAKEKGAVASGVAARLAAWCGVTARQAWQGMIDAIPTWGKVNKGTLLRLRLFVLPFGALGAILILTSFGNYFLWIFRELPPEVTVGMSPLLTTLCVVTALTALVLMGCNTPELPEQTRANWWFVTVFMNQVTWTVAVMTHKGYWSDMAVWVAAGMIPALNLDRAATVRLTALSTACGFGYYSLFDNTHTVSDVLQGIAVEWILLVPLYFGIVSLLTGGRQAKLELAVKAMALRGAILAHDAKEPMIAAEDAGQMFAKFMPRLVEAHKEMALIEPERYQRLSKHKYEALLAAGPRLVERARRGLDFFCGMVESLRDPQKRMGKPSAVSVHEAIEKAIHYELTSVQQERVDFRGGPDEIIWVNEDEFAHAVGNFLKNAARHTKPGDRIKAWTEADASAISVCVQDPGTGIARRQRLVIFNPFFTAAKGGTGVGLGMADLVAATLRAALRCLSVLGVGTKMILRIPKTSPEEIARLQRRQQLEEEQEHQELLTKVQRLDDEQTAQEQARPPKCESAVWGSKQTGRRAHPFAAGCTGFFEIAMLVVKGSKKRGSLLAPMKNRLNKRSKGAT